MVGAAWLGLHCLVGCDGGEEKDEVRNSLGAWTLLSAGVIFGGGAKFNLIWRLLRSMLSRIPQIPDVFPNTKPSLNYDDSLFDH